MKRLTLIFACVFLLMACGRTSSPDGRAQLRDEHLQKEIDTLKAQDKVLRDSITVILDRVRLIK